MATPDSTTLKHAVRSAALLLAGGAQDFDPLLERIGDAQVVLIGEASHGTQEFYDLRADITRRLIEEKGFTTVAVEADWPDAYRVDRYVRGQSPDRSAREALGDFRDFPTWTWRNTEVVDFVDWLRLRNAETGASQQAGFYGLDLYSLQPSIDAVIAYLRETDPEAAARARRRYACFSRYRDDPHAYGQAVSMGERRSCETPAAEQLRDLERSAVPSGPAGDALFSALQNARVFVNAERFYRTQSGAGHTSWNLRDAHMMQTLQSLVQRGSNGRPARVVVWAHNSHVGDARATQMGPQGQINLGQLARQQYPKATVLVGFSTYQGTVTAASDWDRPAQRQTVRPGLPGSYEALFHEVGLPAFQLRLNDASLAGLTTPRLQRAIGVVYQPRTERASHYFGASLTQQFDWMIHIDTTRALEPLEPGKRRPSGAPMQPLPRASGKRTGLRVIPQDASSRYVSSAY
ncbi:MAG: Erythromycin esterase homolog [uncultured Lysobacter sp.]|uniref:Erythromycin esterase homolog n=1 Tax=uncultured Lysobacter sp. TaxID=271060 RepID=A0A6J4M0X8_9GAMM|nr:MAG: Erythromycin esterase homolog [uncultured Lysobacter sp.]